jgi:para-aminobenzoate synthetase component I
VATARSTSFRRSLDLSRDRVAAVVAAMPEPAILDGGVGWGSAGRWSVYTAAPRLVFEADDNSWELSRLGQVLQSGAADPLVALAEIIGEFGLAGSTEAMDPAASPFEGGLIGFFGYDLAPRLERLPRKAKPDSRLPMIRFGLYDWAVSHNHETGQTQLEVYDLFRENRLEFRLEELRRELTGPPSATVPSRLREPLGSNFAPEDYRVAVDRALEYIAAGDIFQVNLSQRFTARGDLHPWDLYDRLRRRSPAPFAAFLQWRDLAVISASPECFYQTRGDKIVTRPIKGTRPRGRSLSDDSRLARELQDSAKDRAELTMIVDLERNDLGRVCQFGSIRVSEPLVVESFAQVHHLVATVEGSLRPDVGPIDVVRAVFPGGSITGAPKIRAMQIIDELEPTRRNLYTGAIGYFSRGGSSAFNIAIRTMVVEGDRVSYQVGGGIVADSNPEAEFQETLHKGRGLREVLEGWGIDR